MSRMWGSAEHFEGGNLVLIYSLYIVQFSVKVSIILFVNKVFHTG